MCKIVWGALKVFSVPHVFFVHIDCIMRCLDADHLQLACVCRAPQVLISRSNFVAFDGLIWCHLSSEKSPSV